MKPRCRVRVIIMFRVRIMVSSNGIVSVSPRYGED